MTIQTVTLSQLALSPLNVRKVKPSQIETLAEDIAAHGIIQSLGVYEEDSKFHVFAGGRRLRALQHLQKAKTIGADYEVPVVIRPKAEAVELSTAENISREAMHVADQVRAFATMREEGHTASEIAARFGYSEGHVARLLKLGSLSPSLLKAMAEDELSLDSAKALCLTDDHKAQREAFKACGDNAWRIRRYFSEDKIATDSRLFLFVGKEEYEAAGGTVTIDLFSEGEGGYADNPELLEGLAHAKLTAIGEQLEGAGWFKVRVELDTPDDYYSLRPMYPTERELTPEEDEQLAQIEAELAKIEEAWEELEDAEWEKRYPVGSEELDAQREEILEGARSYTDDQKQIGGVIVTVGHNGEPTLKHYFAVTPKQEGEGEGKADSPYSAKLDDDLRSLRTLALQAKVAQNAPLALDILLDTLAATLLHGRWRGGTAVQIEGQVARIEVPQELHDERIGSTAEAVAQAFASLPSASRFEAIQALDNADKMDLLAGLVAMTISSTGVNSPYEQAAGLDMGEVWSVNVPFCDRLTKKQALAIMEEECGADAAANCKSLKKGEVAEQLAERLPVGWLPQALRGPSPSPQTEDEETSEVA